MKARSVLAGTTSRGRRTALGTWQSRERKGKDQVVQREKGGGRRANQVVPEPPRGRRNQGRNQNIICSRGVKLGRELRRALCPFRHLNLPEGYFKKAAIKKKKRPVHNYTVSPEEARPYKLTSERETERSESTTQVSFDGSPTSGGG